MRRPCRRGVEPEGADLTRSKQMFKSSAQNRREALKSEYWAKQPAWTGDKERGWFRAPRTLPLILTLLSSKELSGKVDPSRVYIDLLARHRDSGIVEMGPEGDHSYSAGYVGPRGIRTWQERMALLEKLGFIKTKPGDNLRYRYVLLMHPAVVLKQLRDLGKVSDAWWELYRGVQIEGRETQHEAFEEAEAPAKVVPIRKSKGKDAKKRA